MMVNKGKHPKMAQHLRLVNYYNLPIYIYIYTYIYIYIRIYIYIHLKSNLVLTHIQYYQQKQAKSFEH